MDTQPGTTAVRTASTRLSWLNEPRHEDSGGNVLAGRANSTEQQADLRDMLLTLGIDSPNTVVEFAAQTARVEL